MSDELYQLEQEHSKGAKPHLNNVLEVEGKKCSKIYFNVLEKQMQNKIMSELYTDGNKI